MTTNKSRKIMLDTNVYMDYLTERDTDDLKKAQFLLDGQRDNKWKIVLPTIIIAELACRPYTRSSTYTNYTDEERAGINTRTNDFLNIVETHFLICELDVDVALKAGEIGTQFTLKGSDAVIVASAFYSDCSHLYTRDGQILKISHSIPPLKIESPPEPPPLSTLF